LFCKKYKDSAVIIGIPSLEDGYTEGNKAVVKKRLNSNKVCFLLTEAMTTRKASGAQQSPLMQWLTNKDLNTHFDQDAKGAGHKFFVDETGELYGVMPPAAPLSHPIFDRIMSRPRKFASSPK
jgi:glutathione peroxidase-family protein